MKTTTLIAVAGTTLAASLSAFANGTSSDDTHSFARGELYFVAPAVGQPSTRDQVRAELAAARANHELSFGELGDQSAVSRAAAPLESSLDRATVRAQAAEAVRLGVIPSGERAF